MAQHADRLPATISDSLASNARSIAATNLAIAAECRELQQLFEGARLPLLFLKGLTVGALAYRSPLLKMGWDIDLLIAPADLESAAKLLSDRGYEVRIPADVGQLAAWHSWSKESVWHRDGVLQVELHTRLADNQRLIPSIDVRSRRQDVEIARGVSLETLADEELFAYLAVHGASSAWFRLKWISDFAGLIHNRGGQQIDRLYRSSQDLGAGRAAGQALLLADRLFGALEPVPALKMELERDRATRWLCEAALRLMTTGSDEPTERMFGTLAIHWTQLLLRPQLEFKLSELKRQGANLFRWLPR